MGLMSGKLLIPNKRKRFISSPKHIDQLWDPPNLLPTGIRVISLRVKGRSAPLIAQLHLVPWLRMSATIYLVHTCLCCTYRDKFFTTKKKVP